MLSSTSIRRTLAEPNTQEAKRHARESHFDVCSSNLGAVNLIAPQRTHEFPFGVFASRAAFIFE
jgi:hypothetical protein